LSTRTIAKQNLLVASVNAALERHLLTLECEPVASAVFEFNIGPYPVIAALDDAGFDEVAIKAIVCPTELGRRMVQCAIFHGWQRFGEATTFAWLERRTGKYLQSSVNYHGTKAVTSAGGQSHRSASAPSQPRPVMIASACLAGANQGVRHERETVLTSAEFVRASDVVMQRRGYDSDWGGLRLEGLERVYPAYPGGGVYPIDIERRTGEADARHDPAGRR
jgi:hypothetical protein